MKNRDISTAIKTIVRVDQGVDDVKKTINELLENDTNLTATPVRHSAGNSFILGWVKSFHIIMISVTLRKEAENRTTISLETIKPVTDIKKGRIVQEGFSDFLSFLKRTLIPQKVQVPEAEMVYIPDGTNTGLWKWVFIVLLITFMSWYFIQN